MDIGKTAAPHRSATSSDASGTPGAAYRPSDHERERQRYRRSRKRRHTWVSLVCTLLGLTAVGAAAVASPGWERVDSLFFDGAELRSAFPDLLRGFWLNIQMFLVAEVLILVLGLLIALVRVTRAPGLQPLRLAATVYVDVFRGVPTLLLVFLVGFGLPALQLQGTPPSRGSSASSPWSSPTRPTSPRCSGRDWTRSTPRSGTPPGPWASTSGRPCGTSCCPRRCATCSRPCSTTSSPCRRTPRWSPSSARSKRCGPRRSRRTTTSTTPRTWERPSCSSR